MKKHEIGKSKFPQRCRQLRRQKNLSQKELGKSIGIHFTHISRYERDLSKPSAEVLIRLADALGVTPDYLIEGATDAAAKGRLEDRELLYIFQEIEKLPDDDKAVVKKFLDAFLTKKKVQELAKT